MRQLRHFLHLGLGIAAFCALATLLIGCGGSARAGASFGAAAAGTPTNNLDEVRLKVGELLNIAYSDVNPQMQAFEGRIREDGKITLILNKEFDAAGKTITELEKDIHERYVPDYFRNLTATVKVLDRFFYVDGFVRRPDRIPFANRITLQGAISAAGGFNEFAQPKKVQITRAVSGKVEIVDCNKLKKHPENDPWIFPNDKIWVPRRGI
jgi:polysaccharide export outer membrane protein